MVQAVNSSATSWYTCDGAHLERVTQVSEVEWYLRSQNIHDHKT